MGAEGLVVEKRIVVGIASFGMPEAVTAHVRIMRTGGEVEDWDDVRLHYPDVNVLLRGSYQVKELGPRYILHGTNGSFVKVGLDPQEEAAIVIRIIDAARRSSEQRRTIGIARGRS
ncbi:MAG: oxidoreductase [Bacteroidetes bacterium]|nr:oxidoreductase [Bacteroidota bacterium]